MDDVSDWTVEETSRGGTEGYWIRQQHAHERRALVKLSKVRDTFVEGEHVAEAVASWVGQAMGLPVQEVKLVRYNKRVASLAWDFCVPNLELREGAVLMGATAHRQRLTLKEVRRLLSSALGKSDAQRQLIEMVCFDILIGNSDRHYRNWAILVPRTGGPPRMARTTTTDQPWVRRKSWTSSSSIWSGAGSVSIEVSVMR